jgi:prepilin-type N-terminal cleavage/methylation domain-containing protein
MKLETTQRRIERASNLQGFTLIELLVVISVIGILASLIVGVSGVATTKARLSQTTALLHNVSTAIDSYHADRGSFPPDALFRDGTVNTVINPLFYELTGTVYTDRRTYTSISGSEEISRPQINQFFGRDGFQNVARNEAQVKGYLNVGASEVGEISVNPNVRVLTAPIPWPLKQLQGSYQNVLGTNIELETLRPYKGGDQRLRGINPWQYRSSGLNRFNQQSYDLWADLVIGTKVYRVNNWSTQPKVFEALPEG